MAHWPRETEHSEITRAYIRDVMTPEPIIVSLETTVGAARHLMQQHRLGHLPVCEAGRLIGLLSTPDLLRVLPSPATSLAAHELHYLLERLTVAEVMSRFPVTIGPHHTVSEAVRRLLSHQVEALPVTENRRVVGMLTRADLLHAFSRSRGLCHIWPLEALAVHFVSPVPVMCPVNTAT